MKQKLTVYLVILGVLISTLSCSLLSKKYTYLPNGLAPGIWVGDPVIESQENPFWAQSAGYMGGSIFLPLKDRPDCVHKSVSYCELVDKNTIRIKLTDQYNGTTTTTLKVEKVSGGQVTLFDVNSGAEVVLHKVADDTSKDDLERRIVGQWTFVNSSLSYASGAMGEIQFNADNSITETDRMYSTPEERHGSYVWVSKDQFTINYTGDPFDYSVDFQILEDFGDIIILGYDNEGHPKLVLRR
jgi:hypothetical protein